MLDSTYADKAFSANIAELTASTGRIATALEAIANHLGVLCGIAKNSIANTPLHINREGFVEPLLTGLHNP